MKREDLEVGQKVVVHHGYRMRSSIGTVLEVRRLLVEITTSDSKFGGRTYRIDTQKENSKDARGRFETLEQNQQAERLRVAKDTLHALGVTFVSPWAPGFTLEQIEELAALVKSFKKGE